MPQLTTILIFLNFAITIYLIFLVYRLRKHYNNLLKGAGQKSLLEILEQLLRNQSDAKKQILNLSEILKQVIAENKWYLQKIGIVRFNPFLDIGGAQSFTLSLLDKGNNGVVLTSLYSRNSSRWYIKPVKDGQGYKVELSKEEQEAIKGSGAIRDLQLK